MMPRTILGLSPGRLFRELLPLLLLMLVVDGSFAYLFLVVLQAYVPRQPGGSVALPGYALAAFGLTKLLFQVGTGALSDRIGRRHVVLIGLGIDILAILVLVAVRTPLFTIPFGALFGLGSATVWPALESEVVGRFSSDVRGRIASIMLLTVAAAMPLGFGIGALVVDMFDYRTALAVAIVPLTVGVLLTFAWVQRREAAHGATEVDLSVRTLRIVLADRRRLIFALLIVAYIAAGSAIIPTFHPYATEYLRLSLRSFVIVLIPAGAAGGLATIVGGMVSDRIGRFPLLITGMLLIEIGLMLILKTRDPARVALYAIIPAAGIAITVPAVGAGFWDLAGDRYRGAVLGFFLTAEGLGQSIGPAIGGYVTEAAGPLQTFRISMGLYAVAIAVGVLLWVLVSKQTRPPLQSRLQPGRVKPAQ